MENLIQNCDILFHELCYGPTLSDMDRNVLREPESKYVKLQKEFFGQERTKARWDKIIASAAYWKHSTAEMTGVFAEKVKAKQLVLIHIGARYEVKNPEVRAKIETMLKNRVGEFYHGPMVLSHDGTIITM